VFPRQCRILLRIASVIVPRRQRDAWLRRWDAELWGRQITLARAGKSDEWINTQLVRASITAVPDALWHRFNRDSLLDSTRESLGSPRVLIAALLCLIAIIGVTSSGFVHIRRAAFGPNIEHADRLAIVATQDRVFGWRYPVEVKIFERWWKATRSFDKVAAFSFARSWITHAGTKLGGPFSHAVVSPQFFDVLGTHAAEGRLFSAGDTKSRPDEIVVSDWFRRQFLDHKRAAVGQSIELDNRSRTVIGVLPKNFWFLVDRVGAVSLLEHSPKIDRVLGVGRLRDASLPLVNERFRIRAREVIDVNRLVERTEEPLINYGTGTGVALIAVALFTIFRLFREKTARAYWMFFFAKAALGVALIFLFTMEHAGAGSLTGTAGSSGRTELPAFFFWLLTSVLWIAWSIRDQRMRCRDCLTRLVLPVRIGLPGRVLFEHEGTELVCPRGHGMLYVEPTTETFRQSGRWMQLDASWLDVFTDKR